MSFKVHVPLYGTGDELREERVLYFIDISESEYNIVLHIKDRETGKTKDVIICGHCRKLDIKRLAKAS